MRHSTETLTVLTAVVAVGAAVGKVVSPELMAVVTGVSCGLYAVHRGLAKSIGTGMERTTRAIGGHPAPVKRFKSRAEWAAAQPDDLFDPPWHWKLRRALGLRAGPLPPIVIPECGPVKPPPRPGVKALADRPLRLGDTAIGGLPPREAIPHVQMQDHIATQQREVSELREKIAYIERHKRPSYREETCPVCHGIGIVHSSQHGPLKCACCGMTGRVRPRVRE
jgi:hypothetical protein